MTDQPATPGTSPHELLAAVRDLSRRVRVAQRGSWFPLLVFAATMLLAIPMYRLGPRHLGPCRATSTGTTVCTAIVPAVLVYWPVALVLSYALIAGFYLRKARSRGLGTLVRPYLSTGLAIAVLLAAVAGWRWTHPRTPPTAVHPHASLTLLDLATPAVAIGLALLVLAWVERNPTLAAFSLVYLVVVVADATRFIQSTSPWWFLRQLLVPAALLLLGSGVLAGTGRLRPPR